ncbi:MAG: hypothetical protein HY289_12815, partial [Planctomycetes bacterium]|nr:hypothetical protein [Planctomycetota bacterium]
MQRSILLLGIAGLLTIFGLASLGATQEPKQDLQNPIEVQARGPLHEAFAQPFDVKPEPGPMIPKEPPPLINEEPPEQRPEADSTQWIPGYWAWDAQRAEFMWVSGVYRVPPQGRTFVPGYWQNTPEGWRWIHGFWAGQNQQELPYTPEPPAPLDNGPSMPAPDVESSYIPGSWIYRDTRFIWRPGYYAANRPGRVWNPPRFVWTPNGYIFVDGYWDYPYEDRGLVFAPVYFRRPLWHDAGWRFRPSLVIGFDDFYDSAFVYGGGFYFGNYYDPLYSRLGYRPWYHDRGRYDPAFSHYASRNQRNNPNWIAGVQQTYAGRTSGRIAAPVIAATPVAQFKSSQVRLVNTSPAQLAAQQTQIKTTRQIAATRQQQEVVVTKSSAGKTFQAPAGARTLNLSSFVPANTASPSTKFESPRSVTPAPKFDTPRIVTPPPAAKSTFTPPPPPPAAKSTYTPPPRVTTPPPPPPRVT